MKSRLYRLLQKNKRFLALRYEFWREYRSTGEWELRELKNYVDPAKDSVDIGGNLGTYSYFLSRLSSSVLTFEPNPEYVQILKDLRLPRWRVEAVALSDQSGVANLRIPLLSSGREDRGMASIEAAVVSDQALSRAIEVPMRRLDDYGLANVGFIKIDVEGHEEGVVAGARETIERNRPALLIEIEERHNRGGIARLQALLGEAGYDGFFFHDGVRRSLAEFSAARHQVDAPDVLGKGRRHGGYINNFLFVPRA